MRTYITVTLDCIQQTNTDIKKIFNVPVLAFLAIILTMTACDEGNKIDNVPVVEYPSLKVVNESRENRPITGVALVGYSFGSLHIDTGESKTFALDTGIQGGYEDVYIKVNYGDRYGSYGSKSIEVNYYKGETTTITLKGCHGAGGCTGFYLE